jgi:hypothetical protein
MKTKSWIIEYCNDTGPRDEYFHQWWEITDGEIVLRCDKERDAKYIQTILNVYEALAK